MPEHLVVERALPALYAWNTVVDSIPIIQKTKIND
jgi:hypothetical protein